VGATAVGPRRAGDADAAEAEVVLTARDVAVRAELHTVWDVVGAVRVRGRVNDRALAGDRGAPHVVLVHGLGMATDYLEPTMRALGNELAVSALDLPGFGGSRRSAGEGGYRSLDSALRAPLGMTSGVVPSEQSNPVIPSERSESRDLHWRAPTLLGEFADALIEWLGVRGIVAPVLVGQSHGCQVVVEVVSRVPALASALVLNAPTMVAEHRSIGAQLWRVAMDTPREPPSLVPHVARDYLRAGPRRLLATLKDALRDRIEDKLPAVRVSVTIVTGARDPVSPPAWCERLARLVGSGGRLVVVPGAAHAVPFSHPEALAAEIAAAVRAVENLGAPG
jgi:2-hydroxy-6-oxonona-2,4-dienedioate hydrolase